MAHAIPRAALAARGGHCLFYNSIRYTRRMAYFIIPSVFHGACHPPSRVSGEGGHGLFYNSVRIPRRMPFSGNAPSPSLGGRSSGLIKYELRSCSPSSRATSVARGSIAYFNSFPRHPFLHMQIQILQFSSKFIILCN